MEFSCFSLLNFKHSMSNSNRNIFQECWTGESVKFDNFSLAISPNSAMNFPRKSKEKCFWKIYVLNRCQIFLYKKNTFLFFSTKIISRWPGLEFWCWRLYWCMWWSVMLTSPKIELAVWFASKDLFKTIGFFINSPQHKNANIANFVLAVPLKRN